jgi:hypothetical protein
MDNMQMLENLKNLDLFFDGVGFDEETKKDHLARIMTIILASVSEKLDQVTELKDKTDSPEIESLNDFYDYYEQYIDRSTIDKVIEEESQKAFTGYVSAISDKLPK